MVDDCKFLEDNLNKDSRNSGLCPENFVGKQGAVGDLKQGPNGPGCKPSAMGGGGANLTMDHGLSLLGSINSAQSSVDVPVKGGMDSDRGKAPVSLSDPPSSSPLALPLPNYLLPSVRLSTLRGG